MDVKQSKTINKFSTPWKLWIKLWKRTSRVNLQLYQPRTKLEQFEDIIMESKLLNGFNGSSAAALGGTTETNLDLQ